jgi:hypothetical protein
MTKCVPAMLSLLLGCCSCSTQPWAVDRLEPGVKRMTQTQIVAAGQQFAAERGYSLTDYKQPRLSFRSEDHTWSLWFWGKERTAGNYLLIAVDDQTGRAELIPSR